MTFYVEDEGRISLELDVEEVVGMVAKEVLEEEACPYEVQLNVLLTDNEGIRKFNKEYREIDRETDVLSFPNLDYENPSDFSCAEDEDLEADYFDPDSGELILGDIIVSTDKVKEQAENFAHSLKREFAFLIAHSMYHLCGYDHMTEEEASVMEKKQEAVLQRLGITRDV